MPRSGGKTKLELIIRAGISVVRMSQAKERKVLATLIAEDHSSIAETYKMVLELEGHKVTLASDGQDCIEKFDEALKQENGSSPFDVIVLDFNLPRIDGIQVARHILSLAPNQRIIMASSYPREIICDSAGEPDRQIELLVKPFDLTDLADMVAGKRAPDVMGGKSQGKYRTVA